MNNQQTVKTICARAIDGELEILYEHLAGIDLLLDQATQGLTDAFQDFQGEPGATHWWELELARWCYQRAWFARENARRYEWYFCERLDGQGVFVALDSLQETIGSVAIIHHNLQEVMDNPATTYEASMSEEGEEHASH